MDNLENEFQDEEIQEEESIEVVLKVVLEVAKEEVLPPLDKDYEKILKKRAIIVLISIGIMTLTSLFSNYHDFNIVLRSKILVYVLSFTLFATSGSYLYFKSMSEEKRNQSGYKLKKMLEVIDVLIIVPIFMLAITLINVSSFSLSNVVGKSMEPNYFDQEDVVIMHVPFMEFERLDPVVVKIDEDVFYIKRIIGLPGEFIVIDKGNIYRADSSEGELTLIDQSSLGDINDTFCTVNSGDYCEFTIPNDSYFVMGDNRTNSSDSRNQRVGFIDEDNLYGKVVFKYKNILRNRP